MSINLQAKRDRLFEEKSKKFITEDDLKEIDQQVEEYKKALIDLKQEQYDQEIRELDAKIELLDELIEEEAAPCNSL